MNSYTYFMVDLGALSIPLIFSFHHKIRFNKSLKSFFLATFLVSIPFLIWDIIFTKYSIWGFDSDYLCGLNLFGLPLEEYLFFICIPYACVFTYFSIKKLWSHKFIKHSQTITYILLGFSLLMLAINYDKAYTLCTFLLLSSFLIYLIFIKAQWVNHFYFSYLILLIPFSITNGILTGSGLEKPIVWYDNAENMGIRLGTIPVEDVFYGMLLILSIVYIFEQLENKKKVNGNT